MENVKREFSRVDRAHQEFQFSELTLLNTSGHVPDVIGKAGGEGGGGGGGGNSGGDSGGDGGDGGEGGGGGDDKPQCRDADWQPNPDPQQQRQ